MEHAFWQGRWETGQIGFHEGKPNDLLVTHGHRIDEKRRVLVPLSGKSHDQWWLAKRGHDVVGIEFVDSVAPAFFAEAGVTPNAGQMGPFRALAGAGVTALTGDFFDATPEALGTFDAAWDRAALVALDPASRRRYVDTLAALLAPAAVLLLVTLTYDQALVAGPPWSVAHEEIPTLFEAQFAIEQIARGAGAPSAKMQEAGATLEETLWALTRRSP